MLNKSFGSGGGMGREHFAAGMGVNVHRPLDVLGNPFSGPSGYGTPSVAFYAPVPVSAPLPHGAGPADVGIRLDLQNGPVVYAVPWTEGGKVWQRHTSADERRRFDLAHQRLDDTSYYYLPSSKEVSDFGGVDAKAREAIYPRTSNFARNVALTRARIDLIRCANNDACWQRFRQERMRLELGREYFGVELDRPFYFSAPGKPTSTTANPWCWMQLPNSDDSEKGHRAIDNGSLDIDAAAELVCKIKSGRARREECQRKFSQERAYLEWIRQVRALSAARPVVEQFGRFILTANGQVIQKSALALDDTPPQRPQGQAFVARVDRSGMQQAQPDVEAARSRFSGNEQVQIPRFALSPQQRQAPMVAQLGRVTSNQPLTTPDPNDTLATPEQRAQAVAEANALLTQIPFKTDADLAAIAETVLRLIADSRFTAEQRAVLQQLILALATEKGRRDLAADAAAAGLTLEEYLSQQVQLEAPSLIKRIVCWFKNLVGWDDEACRAMDQVLEMTGGQTGSVELVSSSAEPLPMADTTPLPLGAGPEEDAETQPPKRSILGFLGNVVSKTSDKVGTVATYLLIAGVILAIGWMVTVTFLAPHVFPFFGRLFDGAFGFGGKVVSSGADLAGKAMGEGGKLVSGAGGLGGRTMADMGKTIGTIAA